MNYNDKKEDIMFLKSKGWAILEVEMGDSSLFFQTNNFEPPSIGSVMSAPYMTFKGVDITDFLTNSVFNQANETMYFERFNTLVDRAKPMDFQFSDKHTWRFFN